MAILHDRSDSMLYDRFGELLYDRFPMEIDPGMEATTDPEGNISLPSELGDVERGVQSCADIPYYLRFGYHAIFPPIA